VPLEQVSEAHCELLVQAVPAVSLKHPRQLPAVQTSPVVHAAPAVPASPPQPAVAPQ
jgi:hypothetical protein